MKHTLVRVCRAIGLACLAAAPALALADTYPSRPLRFIVPYAAGGLPDTVARILSQRLPEALGQAVFIENKPGANGAVAAAALATAPADGHTFIVTDGSMVTINPLLSKKLAYDPKKDFAPVSLVATSPLFLAVHPSVKANTLEQFVAYVKARPGKMNYGSSGIGSSHHLTMEAMKPALGLFVTHIPYRGSSASVPALIGGQVDMVFSAYPSLAGFVKTGQAKLIAVNSAARSTLEPGVPAIAEKVPGFNFAVNVVVFAPAGTPPEAIQRLSAEIAKVVRRPDVIEQMKTAGIEPLGLGPAALGQALADEAARMAKAAQTANLKPE
jgi:tripartite-type tricarboxylate transporter receptor subunit TctC